MNIKFFLILIGFFIILVSSLRLLSHPSIEFDEGVYWRSFLLVKKGLGLYNQVFFSQPPGFFVLTYPIFNFFGSSLEAARLSIFAWSIVGLFGIIWVAHALKNIWIAALTIALLYLMPLYSFETLTFHADLLSMVFVILSVASIIKYENSLKNKWVYLSSFFISLALLTKLNIIPIFPFIWILFRKKRLTLKFSLLIILIFLITFLTFIMSFDIKSVFDNVILFRIHAAVFFRDQLKFFEYLNVQGLLSMFMLVTFVLLFINKKNLKKYETLIVWFITSILATFIYHPLEPHHLLFIAIPTVIMFSILLTETMKKYLNIRILNVIISIIFFISLISFLYESLSSSKEITLMSQKKAIEMINQYSKKTDLMVSDDGILNAVTGRLSPPQLADLSHVRIDSGYLSTKYFEKTIQKYKPKLVLAWNRRLIRLSNFQKIMKENGYRLLYSNPENQLVFMYP